MPPKRAHKRTKRPSTPTRQATASPVGTQTTEPAGPRARDDGSSHDFSCAVPIAGADDAVAAPADSASTPPALDKRAASKKQATKPLGGYCEFCETTFEDMVVVRVQSIAGIAGLRLC